MIPSKFISEGSDKFSADKANNAMKNKEEIRQIGARVGMGEIWKEAKWMKKELEHNETC